MVGGFSKILNPNVEALHLTQAFACKPALDLNSMAGLQSKA